MASTAELPQIQFRLASLAAAGPPAAARMRSTQPRANASTFGWDTAFAIRIPDVNRAIGHSDARPVAFQFEAPDRSCSLAGTFGAWEVCRGGDGVNLHLRVPVLQGTLTWQGEAHAIDAAVATIEVRLDYLPRSAQPADPRQGAVRDLVVRTVSATPGTPVVSVLDVSYSGTLPDFMTASLVRASLKGWFNSHLETFTHVFSSVNVNRLVDHAQFQWLAPTEVSYAFVNGATDEDCLLGVLCMTRGRSSSGLAGQLSPNAIPTGSRAGLLISPTAMLEEMIIPALPSAFPGSSRRDFALSDDRLSVVNRKPLATKPVTYLGFTYHPEVQDLSVTLVGEEIQMSTLTQVDIIPGTHAMIRHTAFHRLVLTKKPDGSQTLTWEQTRDPLTDHWVVNTTGGDIRDVVIAVIGAIVLAILAVATAGAVLVVAIVIVSLLTGLLLATPQLIAGAVGNKVSNESPSLDLLVLNATAPIQWPGGAAFSLDWAGMNTSLQLGGNPGFAG